MQELEELMNEVLVDIYEANSAYWVDVTYIVNPQLFYIRLTKHRDVVEKIAMLKPVLKPEKVALQDIVLFNMSDDIKNPTYARGKVQHVTNIGGKINCSLLALDYGHEKKNIPLEQVWMADGSLLNIPPLAQICQLANCFPRDVEWKSNAIDAFKAYVGKERAKMVVKNVTQSYLLVTLYNTCPDDIATMLALTDFSYLLGVAKHDCNKIEVKTPAAQQPAFLTFRSFKTGEMLHVRVISGKSLDNFYVADVHEYKKYLDQRNLFTQLSKKEAKIDENSVQCGDVVCVDDSYDFEKGYKRGVIKEKHNGKALVHLVDMGKDELLSFRRLSLVPPQYVSMPAVGIHCSVDNVHAYSDPHILLHPGRQLQISIIKPGHELKTPNIIKIIKKLN